jgi:hypothetical protein
LRRGVQLFPRPHDAARAGGDPKIIEMFEIHTC